MYKLFVITKYYSNSIDTKVIEFNDVLAADNAFDIILRTKISSDGRGTSIQVIKLY